MATTNEKNITFFENISKTSHWYIVRIQRNYVKYHKSFQTMHDAVIYRDEIFDSLGIK